jgi:hypothetical protein
MPIAIVWHSDTLRRVRLVEFEDYGQLRVSGSGLTKVRTCLSFPSIKLLEIFQNVWSEDSATSETFLIMLWIDCHTGSAREFAEGRHWNQLNSNQEASHQEKSLVFALAIRQ